MLNVRQFSLEYSDLTTTIKNLAFIFRNATINIDGNKERVPLIYHLLAGFCFASYVYVYEVSMVWFVFVRCMETRDFTAASIEFSLGMCSITGLTHFMHLKLSRSKIKYIVDKYLEYDRLVIRGTRYYRNLQKYLRMIKKRALTIWTILFLNAMFYILYPFIIPDRSSSQGFLVIYGLEPISESPNYEIAMVLKTGGVFFAGYMVASIKALDLILYGYTEAHLLTMTKEVKSLWNDRNKFFPRGRNKNIFKIRERSINRYIKQQLTDIIQLHIKNRGLINLLESNVRGARVIDIATITFAVIAELLGGLGNTFIQGNFTMVILFIDCVVGQKIIDANEVFIQAIYGSKWENFDTSNKKTVLLILMNAQRVMKISAGGIMDLSFVSFTTVIRFTYSTYTTLKSAIK